MAARAWIALLLLSAWAAPAGSAWLTPESLAVRVGGNAATIPQDFDYAQIALRGRLPWQGQWGGWTRLTHLELGAGRLRSDDDHAELYTLGPSLSFGRGGFAIDLGIAPGYLNQRSMNGRNFGGDIQFTSHLAVYLGSGRWRIGYRIQHTSNGHLYRFNDGLDLQMVELSRRF